MKIAIVPYGKEDLHNKIFDSESKANRDNVNAHKIILRDLMMQDGIEVNTIDLYDDLEKIDFFIFFYFDKKMLYKLIKAGYADKLIYFNAEPEVVEPLNSRDGLNEVLKYFKYAMTWNDDLVDNIRIFKRICAYYFEDKRVSNDLKYSEKKLLVNISGYKFSIHPKELYSERMRVIEYFEKNHSEEFMFYGQGWPIGVYKNYGGAVENKAVVYSRFRFALALENMRDVRGYITEKILDCFTSGIVPIYLGASDISDYIPADCYIHYDEFDSMDKLYDFLASMDEETYNQYIARINNYLISDKVNRFSPEYQYKCIMDVCQRGIDAKFLPSKKAINKLKKEIIIQEVRNKGSKIKRIVRNIKNVFKKSKKQA